jgi:hypothetical protein
VTRSSISIVLHAGDFSPVYVSPQPAGNRAGRPLGDERFIERLESTLARSSKKRKPGPKRTRGDDEQPGKNGNELSKASP